MYLEKRKIHTTLTRSSIKKMVNIDQSKRRSNFMFLFILLSLLLLYLR